MTLNFRQLYMNTPHYRCPNGREMESGGNVEDACRAELILELVRDIGKLSWPVTEGYASVSYSLTDMRLSLMDRPERFSSGQKQFSSLSMGHRQT